MATQRNAGLSKDVDKSPMHAAPQVSLKHLDLSRNHRNISEHSRQPFDTPPAATDLIRLLRYMESELQARDAAIAILKAEKVKHTFYQAKYSRFGLADPFHALQRDSDHVKQDSFDENAVRAMFDSQLGQLENLIATQRKAQLKMREQLVLAEKKYNKVCTELEEEKHKHAQDTARGDDVTVALEKDRERLKQEIDFERAQNKKQEKELRKGAQQLEELQHFTDKHKQVAIALIKERRQMVAKVLEAERLNEAVAQMLDKEKEESARHECVQLMQMEAKMERQLSEFDIEREQLRAKLRREVTRCADLSKQLESLRALLSQKATVQEPSSGEDCGRKDEGCASNCAALRAPNGGVGTAANIGIAAASPLAQMSTDFQGVLKGHAVLPQVAINGQASGMLPVSAAATTSSTLAAASNCEGLASAVRLMPGPTVTLLATRPVLPPSLQSQNATTSPTRVVPKSPDWLASSALQVTPLHLAHLATAKALPPVVGAAESAKHDNSTLPLASATGAAQQGHVTAVSILSSSTAATDDIAASDYGDVASSSMSAGTAKGLSPVPAARKPVPLAIKLGPPPIPPNKPMIAVTKHPVAVTHNALTSVPQTAAIAHQPSPPLAQVTSAVPVTSSAVEPSKKLQAPVFSGLASPKVATAVTKPPSVTVVNSPVSAAKQRPPPPQRVVSLQKLPATTSSTISVSSGTTASTVLRKSVIQAVANDRDK